VEECADRVLSLLRSPSLADEMGRAGRERVRDNFLVTRNLRDYLHILRTLAGLEPAIEGRALVNAGRLGAAGGSG
jgi:trehalose synthase